MKTAKVLSYYGVNGIQFLPRAGGISLSGLNLQRTPGVDGAHSLMRVPGQESRSTTADDAHKGTGFNNIS